MVQELSVQKLDEVITNSSLPVLIDFWAAWCGPCRSIAPVVDELSEEFAGKVFFYKFNVDESADIPSRFSIRAIPTIIIFKDKKIFDRITGSVSKSSLQELIKKSLV